MKARIKFRKYGIMRFIGHLDVMRYFQKAMRRADMYETVPVPGEWERALEVFLKETTLNVMKKTKRSEKEVNIRPMIYRMEASGEGLSMFLAAGSEENLKPDLVMETFLKYMGLAPEEHPFHIHRKDLYAKTADGSYLPLEDLGHRIQM